MQRGFAMQVFCLVEGFCHVEGFCCVEGCHFYVLSLQYHGSLFLSFSLQGDQDVEEILKMVLVFANTIGGSMGAIFHEQLVHIKCLIGFGMDEEPTCKSGSIAKQPATINWNHTLYCIFHSVDHDVDQAVALTLLPCRTSEWAIMWRKNYFLRKN